MIKNVIFFTLMLLIQQINTQTCSCPSTAPVPPQPLAENPTFAVQDEIINGVNYGKPFVVANLIFLPGDIKVSASTTSLLATCPSGWRVPTAAELSQLLAVLGSTAYTELTKSTGFAALDDFNYLTIDKSYPLSTAGNLNESWMFKGIYVDPATQTVELVDVNTYWEPYKSVRCVMDNRLPVNMTPSDLFATLSYPVSIARPNLVSYLWRYQDKLDTNNSINLTFANTGCYLLEGWARTIANTNSYFCRPVYVRNAFGSDGAISTFALTNVRSRSLNVLATKEKSIFFNEGNAPVAPRPDGGFYILYSDFTTGNLIVMEFNASRTLLKSTDLAVRARPMDITVTPWGFVILHKDFDDNNLVNLTAFNADYTQRWNRVLMNNGELPTTVRDQITFFDNKSVPVAGNSCNFAAQGGKLNYGRGRIAVIWARYNYFGVFADGSRNDHTGDTWMSFDEDGQNEDYAFSWGTSHSLIQSQIYTGRYFVTASLGDAYPQNIQVCVIDNAYDTFFDGVRQKNVRRNKVCTSIVSGGNIPGDARGKVCGRFGGIHQLGNTFAVVFTRKPCSLVNAENGQTTSTTLNEISLMTFNYNPSTKAFTNITRRTLLSSVSDRINAIRSGKWGNRILINYLTQSTLVSNTDTPTMSIAGTEQASYMVVGFDGTIVRTTVSYTPQTVAPSDDMRTLADGTLVWTNVDATTNTLSLYSTTAPPVLTSTATDAAEVITS